MINNFRKSLSCCRLSFFKGFRNARTFAVATLILAFLCYHLSSLAGFSAEINVGITPWGFSHLLSPMMLLLYGTLTILMFCDAPFLDNQAYYSIIRAGRVNWALGQLCYIILAALIYTVVFYLSSVIVLIPHIEISLDWGKMIKTLALNPYIGSNYGYTIALYVNSAIVNSFGAVEATLISVGLMWLNVSFIGVLIFSCNLLMRRFSGLIVAGFFVCLSYFAYYQGGLMLGEWIGFFSPVSWASMLYLDWGFLGVYYPSPVYAICCQIGAIILMGIVSIVVFCKRDIYETERF